ncbi:MAG: DUF507 family protein [Deltaproteobacteria bacterium]|nr:DUF507 family protein [Deltaproteobacteria bacterium]
MKLYSAKIPIIAREILEQLTKAGDIEVNSRPEAELDVQSVLKEYLRIEREIIEQAKDEVEKKKLGYGELAKIKRRIAERQEFGLGEEGLIWMCNQILETFMQSSFIEEIFATDAVMRKKMADVLRKQMAVDEELDAEVRQRIKNLQEGTANWDVEYAKVMDQIKRKRGIGES